MVTQKEGLEWSPCKWRQSGLLKDRQDSWARVVVVSATAPVCLSILDLPHVFASWANLPPNSWLLPYTHILHPSISIHPSISCHELLVSALPLFWTLLYELLNLCCTCTLSFCSKHCTGALLCLGTETVSSKAFLCRNNVISWNDNINLWACLTVHLHLFPEIEFKKYLICLCSVYFAHCSFKKMKILRWNFYIVIYI